MSGTNGRLSKIDQSHTGASPYLSVAFSYDESVDGSSVYTKGQRQQSVTYPKTSRVIFYDYGTSGGFNDRLGRVQRYRETNSSGTILTEYSYNGTSRPVITDYQVPDVKLDLFGGGSGYYLGFDRFGRTVDHRWIDYSGTPADVSRVKHGYDFAGNRTWREDTVAAANSKNHDEFYAYDKLHRLTNTERGELTGSPTYTGVTSRNFEQDWTLDQLGNWPTFKERDIDTGGTWDLEQDRAHNEANEIASIASSSTHVAHDDAGNMTKIPTSTSWSAHFDLKYDPWNRLIEVKDGSDVVQHNRYDGLGRRIVRGVYASGSLSHKIRYYYNDQWQLLEERKEVSGTEATDPLNQYLWHPYYVDALAIRWYDEDTDGDPAENDDGAYYYLQDANFNVTAVTDDTGAVVERYAYSPYGEVTYLEEDFDVAATQESAIDNQHLYTGRERDVETGLQLNRNRYYAAHLGRWVNRDPIEYEGDEMNLYNYIDNRPFSLSDPMGLEAALPSPIFPNPFPQPNYTRCAIGQVRMVTILVPKTTHENCTSDSDRVEVKFEGALDLTIGVKASISVSRVLTIAPCTQAWLEAKFKCTCTTSWYFGSHVWRCALTATTSREKVIKDICGKDCPACEGK